VPQNVHCMYMAGIFTVAERKFLEAVSEVAYANPFLPELPEREREALGRDYVPQPEFWSLEVDDPDKRRANTWRILPKLDGLIDSVPLRVRRGARPTDRELSLYEDGALYSIYHRFHDQLFELAIKSSHTRTPFYREFLLAWGERMQRPEFTLPSNHQPQHIWACFFQIARAFHYVFTYIIGASQPAAHLRAAVWQSVFTHDIRRYRRSFYNRMGEFATLITGPSGTGKELVARAIALSRYIPFDDRALRFGEDLGGHFHPIHIGALTATLVESELFGHKRGAFTGAMTDRRGLLEACPPLGAVFLDEIGELDSELQMKMLRVIETRLFIPVGDTTSRRFDGKLIAATNRRLPEMIARGSFREDLYYRLCSDLIETPSLSEQIRSSPGVLKDLVRFMAQRNAGEEAAGLAEESLDWIERNLGSEYEWPGNYRELEQCVRNLMIRREYRPARARAAAEGIFGPALRGAVTADELLRTYCTLVYSQTQSYEATARRIALDRRTVKAKIDPALLARLRNPSIQ
jgi:transcriptional regulator with AAA-type ATPase domain